jgi:RNA polymerase sigma-70 factor (ECF subfamily)
MAESDYDNIPLNPDREERFMQLLLKNEPRIYGLILSLVHNWSDADDLMQETCTVMWRKFDDFEEGTNFAAWGMSIGRFQVLNHRKRQRANRARLSEANIEAISDRLTELCQYDDSRHAALEQCVAKLRDTDRQLLQLKYEPDATTKGVAEAVGRSIHAVYKALNRIHSRLLQCVRQNLAEGSA